MSYETVTLVRCDGDGCGLGVLVDGRKLPLGWCVTEREDGKPLHLCGLCRDDLEDIEGLGLTLIETKQ